MLYNRSFPTTLSTVGSESDNIVVNAATTSVSETDFDTTAAVSILCKQGLPVTTLKLC